MRRATRLGILGVCTAVAALVAATGAGAATSVSVACGDSAGLIAAVNAANAAGGGTINLAAGCTYSLTAMNNHTMGPTGLPVVVTPITINGKGATIAGNNTNFRIIAINGPAGGTLALNGVTVTGGHITGQMAGGAGGGILNFSGTLTLNSSVVTGNFASDAGGGIANAIGATATLVKTTVSWNVVSPDSEAGGGGILSIASAITLNQSVVDHNTAPGGGGIASGNGNGGGPGSMITLNSSVISNNTATSPFGGGGGISNGGTLQSDNSQITGNTAEESIGGGLFNHSTAQLNNTIVSGNSVPDGVGGGIANVTFDPSVPATLLMNNGQVTGNSADFGAGGILNVGDSATLHNVSMSSNTPDNCEPPGSVSGCTG
jgi:hypothetical protein